jgi:phosphoribosylformylglycinamidine synthase
MVKALVIRAAGTNCDAEMVRAFTLAGATVELAHLESLIAAPGTIERFDILGFPGGFSFGDDVASGRIFAMKLRSRLYPALRDAARRGCPIIGVCNGFQILVQAGLLPGPEGGVWPEDQPPPQEAALAPNAGGRFIDGWFGVKAEESSVCLWTRGLTSAFAADARDVMTLPIGHGEGRFVAASPAVMARLTASGQIALRYVENPSGSEEGIAGICDSTGRIFGLMPHPERFLDWTRHPYWTRLSAETRNRDTPGMMIFRNAVATAVEVAA